MSKMLFNWTFFFFSSKDVQSGHHSFQGKVGLIYGCFVQLGLALIEKFLYSIISASTTECKNHFSELPVVNFGVFYWFDLVWHCTNKLRCVLKKHIPPKDKVSFLFDIFQADECKSNNLCVGRFFYNTNTLTLFYFYTQITLYSYLVYLSAPWSTWLSR